MIVLADSSIWIDHIRRGDEQLIALLRRRRIVMHPMVIGEIALGSLHDQTAALAEFHELPRATVVPHVEILDMIERLTLFGTGLGYVDAHLLASTLATPGTALMTRDKSLRGHALHLDVAYNPD